MVVSRTAFRGGGKPTTVLSIVADSEGFAGHQEALYDQESMDIAEEPKCSERNEENVEDRNVASTARREEVRLMIVSKRLGTEKPVASGKHT